jgi:hypothetical protein
VTIRSKVRPATGRERPPCRDSTSHRFKIAVTRAFHAARCETSTAVARAPARDRFAHELAAALANVGKPRERVRVAGEVFFANLERDPQRWIVLFGGSAVPVIGELGERLNELRFETVANIVENLHASAAPGVDAENIEAAAHAISGVGEQLGRWWIKNPQIPRERVVQHYTDFIWNGVGARAN